MNAHTHRLTWRTAGLAALALGLWCAPAKARAGCGDGHVPLQPPPAASTTAPRPDRPLAPCTGPTCTRLPLAPPAVPSSVVAPTDDLAALADLTSPATSRPSGRLDDEPSRLPVRQPDSIYHPPR